MYVRTYVCSHTIQSFSSCLKETFLRLNPIPPQARHRPNETIKWNKNIHTRSHVQKNKKQNHKQIQKI